MRHLGFDKRLCGESSLLVGENTMNTDVVDCVPCLWALAAQAVAQLQIAMGAIKRETEKARVLQ